MKHSVMLAQFPGNNVTHPDVADYVRLVSVLAERDPRFLPHSAAEVAALNARCEGRFARINDGERLLHWRKSDTPITMTRNLCVEDAKKAGVDYLVMIDNDMRPDWPYEQPFWETSWEFMLNHRLNQPSVIAAPYCGPPPHENVYVFRWGNRQSFQPNPDFKLDQFPREEAAVLGGIQEVAALPTGLIIIDMRVFDVLAKPYFDYEWKDKSAAEKASTEDVYFSRNLSLAGFRQYCNFGAWAGHHKVKCVHKPMLLNVDDVRKYYTDAMSNPPADEKLVILGDGEIEPPKLLDRYGTMVDNGQGVMVRPGDMASGEDMIDEEREIVASVERHLGRALSASESGYLDALLEGRCTSEVASITLAPDRPSNVEAIMRAIREGEKQ